MASTQPAARRRPCPTPAPPPEAPARSRMRSCRPKPVKQPPTSRRKPRSSLSSLSADHCASTRPRSRSWTRPEPTPRLVPPSDAGTLAPGGYTVFSGRPGVLPLRRAQDAVAPVVETEAPETGPADDAAIAADAPPDATTPEDDAARAALRRTPPVQRPVDAATEAAEAPRAPDRRRFHPRGADPHPAAPASAEHHRCRRKSDRRGGSARGRRGAGRQRAAANERVGRRAKPPPPPRSPPLPDQAAAGVRAATVRPRVWRWRSRTAPAPGPARSSGRPRASSRSAASRPAPHPCARRPPPLPARDRRRGGGPHSLAQHADHPLGRRQRGAGRDAVQRDPPARHQPDRRLRAAQCAARAGPAVERALRQGRGRRPAGPGSRRRRSATRSWCISAADATSR